MNNHISVSVIVPAYNAEKVIETCVRSILRQTLENIEIIIVDDGSRDGTRTRLQRLALEDARIRLILKDQNEGLSAGRNSALKIARGEYVGFVDADDWIEENCLETMYVNGKQADLIVAGYLHDAMDVDRKKINVSRTVKMKNGFWNEKKEIISQAAYVDTAKMFAYTWNKLYKKQCIDKNDLAFSNQVLIEDFIFNTLYWEKIDTLSVIDYAGYHYVKASKDALTQKFLPDFLDIMTLRYDSMKQLLINNGVYRGNIKEQVANVYIKHAIAGVVRNCSNKAKYTWKQQYCKVKNLLSDSNSKEAMKNAKGNSKQEKICNFVFKSNNALWVLVLGKIIYTMQVKSKTAFDKMK